MLAIHPTSRRANSRSPLQTSMARLLKIGITIDSGGFLSGVKLGYLTDGQESSTPGFQNELLQVIGF